MAKGLEARILLCPFPSALHSLLDAVLNAQRQVLAVSIPLSRFGKAD